MRRPDLPDGGSHFPLTADGLYRFFPPRTLSECTPAVFGDAMDLPMPAGRLHATVRLHVNWGHASAQTLERELMDLYE